MSNQLLTYSYTQKVKQEHIDELNHVNNVIYVQWIQEAAVKHWNIVAPDSTKQNYVWVIVRHEIDYKKPAMLHDELVIETRVLEAQTLTSWRQVKIFRKQDMRLLVESKTNWCMVDARTQRPARIPEEVKQIFLG